MISHGNVLFVLLAMNAQYATGTSQQDKICGYRPKTPIVDESLLDMDLLHIRERLEKGQLLHARNVYERGGHSMPTAILTLLDPPASYSYPKGTQVFGVSKEGRHEVAGFLQKPVKWNDSHQNETVHVQYSLRQDGEDASCFVGGLYTFEEATLDGCFEDSGTVEFVLPGETKGMGELFMYTYKENIRSGNINLRTLQSFSSHASSKMKPCFDCPYYHAFQQAFQYYGQADYGDHWILSAVDGTKTHFSSSRGDANFGDHTKLGRAEGVLHGIINMNVFMQVVREMEDAVNTCTIVCQGTLCSSNDHLHLLDKSVAFFCGSLAGPEGDHEIGMLLHSLAQKRFIEFHPSSSKSQRMGDKIIQTFRQAQLALLQGDCATANKEKERIVDLMKVPLIQSVLRYAYVREQNDFETDTEREKALSFGATFAAALLPFVHSCNPNEAKVLYDNMSFGSGEVSFDEVKRSLESTYQCMNIDCDDVGGLLADDEFIPGAFPCDNASLTADQKSRNVGGILFGVALAMTAVGALGFLLREKKFRRKRRFSAGPGANIAAVSDLA